MTVVVNSRDDFTLENYRRVAMGRESVAIGPQARTTMAEGRANFLHLLESDRTPFHLRRDEQLRAAGQANDRAGRATG